MSVWMSETEFRQGEAETLGITINVAFLQEIKEDFGFRQILNEVYHRFHDDEKLHPRVASEQLQALRDELETYFALEECFGYFEHAAQSNPLVCKESCELIGDHEKLYLQLNNLVELSLQIVYRECSSEITVSDLAAQLDEFCISLACHEQDEMDLMMRLMNEDIGVGD